MNDPWTPYGGVPRGVDPVGAVPGISGWILVFIGLSIVGMGIVQLSDSVEGMVQLGVKPTDASLYGFVASFLPLVGAFVATYGATMTGKFGVVTAILFYFWPYLLLLGSWLFGWLHAKKVNVAHPDESEPGTGETAPDP